MSNQGWGQAPPFATIPVGEDHPLASRMAKNNNNNTNQGQDGQHPTPPAQGMPPSNVGGVPPPNAAAPVSAPILQQLRPAVTPPLSGGGGTGSGPSSSSANKPLDTLADEFLSQTSYRTENLGLQPLLRPTPLPADENGFVRLRTLVDRRAWGDVLKLSSTLLNTPTSPYAAVHSSLLVIPPMNVPTPVSEEETNEQAKITPEIQITTIEIMTLQCHAWLKLRRYNDLIREIERWNFITQNDATAKAPTWMNDIWTLHILAGQSQEYIIIDDSPIGTVSRTSATDILYQLRDKISSSTETAWLATIDNALSNIHSRRGQWRLAIGALDRIICLLPDIIKTEISAKSVDKKYSINSNEEKEQLTSILTNTYTCEILSRQGRIFLGVGALLEAAEIFESAKTICIEVGSLLERLEPNLQETLQADCDSLYLISCQMEINEALFYLSKSRYDRALDSFSKALELLRKDNFPVQYKYRSKDWIGPSFGECLTPNTLYNETVNNMAICHLYMCNMKQSVQLLEGVVREDPTLHLTERIAFNLCTLYELGSDNQTGIRKKKTLQLIAKRFFLHDIGPESFRVT